MLRSLWHRCLRRRTDRRAPRTTGGRAAGPYRPRVEGLEDRCVPATFVVTNTLDTGAGSLRQAITSANADTVLDTIQFIIPGSGVRTITPASALPAIKNPVVLDGYSQPGASANTLAAGDNAVLLIELNGTNAGAASNGLAVSASNSTIQGLVINRFGGHGVLLSAGASGDVVQGNFLGTSAAGTSALPNGGDGVHLDGAFNNTVGGTTPAARNVVSGNGSTGVGLLDHVKSNAGFTPGTNTCDLQLTPAGIAAGFTLSTFAEGFTPISNVGPLGIALPDPGGVLVSDETGKVRLFKSDIDNQTLSAAFVAKTTSYGQDLSQGMAQVRNAIYMTRRGSTDDLVQLNNDGTFKRVVVSGWNTSALGITADPVNGHLFVGADNSLWDVDPVASTRTLFLGNLQGPDGMAVSSDGKTLYVAMFSSKHLVAFDIATKAATDLGFIAGLDGTAFGTGALAGYVFVNSNNGTVTQISLADTTQRTVIASGGTRGDFVSVDPTTGTLLLTQSDCIERLTPRAGADFTTTSTTFGNVVEGNYVGTNAAGTAALPNALDGVDLLDGSSNNTIGPGNLISGNSHEGVLLSGLGTSGNTVQGNVIGLNAAGSAAVGNGRHGVQVVAGANHNVIGPNNTISGNGLSGIYVGGAGTSDNQIVGNSVGTNAAGTASVGNGAQGQASQDAQGITIANASGNHVGGSAAGSANVIAGNLGHGVLLMAGSTQNVIEGNYIGTNAASSAGLGNAGDGVHLDGSSGNTVGGTGNVISGNGGSAISLTDDGVVQQLAPAGGAQSGPLTLTAPGTAAGFSFSTLISGLPSSSGVGPLGVAVTATGGVLLSDQAGDVRLFPTDADSQTLASVSQTTNYGSGNAAGLARLGTAYYLAEPTSGAVVQLNADGTLNKTVVTGLPGATGVVADAITGHLFVSTAFQGQIYDVDPVAGTKTLFVTAANPDGLALSSDGRTLYAAVRNFLPDGAYVVGYDVGTGRVTAFHAGPMAGLNGVALGTGALDGLIFASTAGGTVVQINLADPTQQVTIASAGTRGDLVAVDPTTRTLLLTQTDRVARLIPPPAGGFGGAAFNNALLDNFLGTNVTGDAALANGQDGIDLRGGAFHNTVGNNVVSGNGLEGIKLSDGGTAANTIQGNRVGTNAAATAVLGNAGHGIALVGGAANNLVVSGNVVSGNGQTGVLLTDGGTTGNSVSGNFIGTDATGTRMLGNQGSGVQITGARNNLIGGTTPSGGNVIAFNTNAGVLEESGSGNAIRFNTVFGNGGGNIQTPGTGLAAPVLSSAVLNNTTVVSGSLTGPANTTFALDFYSGPSGGPGTLGAGQTYLTTTTVTTDADGNAGFSADLKTAVSPDLFVATAATALSTNDTSPFSQAIAAPQPTVSIAGVTQKEGDSGTTAFGFVVSLSGPSTQAVTVSVATADGTAHAPADYTAVPPTTLTFSPGDRTKTVTVSVQANHVAEPDKSFTVTLSSPTNATLASAARATGTIVNDDHAGVAVVPGGALTVPEGGGPVTYTLALTSQPTSDVTITVIAGAPVTSSTNFLTFTPADWDTPQSVSLSAADDGVFEGSRTGLVAQTITTADPNYRTLVVPSLTVHVTDQLLPPGTLSFSASSADGIDGNTATVTVVRTGGAFGSVSVQYVVSIPGTLALKYQAVPGVDFEGALSGTLTFSAGETQQTLTLPLPADNLVEDTKSFVITLQAPTGGATLGSPAAITVNIRDGNLPTVPDAAPKLATLQQAGSGFGKSPEHYKDFVTKAYARYLNRVPDDAGFAYWVGLMQLYETSGHTHGLRQEQIEAGFLDSPEYLGRYGGLGPAWIQGIYHDLLGRDADAQGLKTWIAALQSGVTPTQVALGFTTSLERLQNRIKDTYHTLLGRDADAQGLAYWVALFQAGYTTEDINSGFVGSVEYYNKADGPAGNPAKWVREAYLDILFRPARTDELAYWLAVLKL